MLAGADEDTADGLDGETTEERLESLIDEMKDKGVNEEELQGLAEKSDGTGQVNNLTAKHKNKLGTYMNLKKEKRAKMLDFSATSNC